MAMNLIRNCSRRMSLIMCIAGLHVILQDNDDWKTGKVNTNWQDEAFQNAPISQYDINVSGGTDKTKIFLSGQYLDQTGIMIGNQL